jgi:hypothetical protein
MTERDVELLVKLYGYRDVFPNYHNEVAYMKRKGWNERHVYLSSTGNGTWHFECWTGNHTWRVSVAKDEVSYETMLEALMELEKQE